MPNAYQLAAPLGAGLLIGISALAVATPPQHLSSSAPLIRYLAHPRDFVRISEGASFTVPAGHLFVVTQLGVRNPTSTSAVTRVLVDGDIKQEVVVDNRAPHVSFEPGIVAPAGSVVEAFATSENFRGSVLGYLSKD